MEPVDPSILTACFHGAQRAGCVYQWGAKPGRDWDSSLVKQSDCSGMSGWLVARATNQAVQLPEGSYDQYDWCRQQGLHQLSQYSDLHYTVADPNRVFIGFELAANSHPGHVWIVYMGRTLECHGPRGSALAGRSWDDPILVRIVDACFELPARDGTGA